MEPTRRMFPAEKVSGTLGSIFAISVILEVIRQGRIQNMFKFPFYAFSVNADTGKGDEWIDEEKYKKVVEDILKYIKDDGLSYFENIKKDITKKATDFPSYALSIIGKLKAFSEDELLKEYGNFTEKYFASFGFGAVTFLYEDILSARLHESLALRSAKVSEELEHLLKTNYKSFMVESEDKLLQIKKAPTSEQKKKLIEEYEKSFFFMKTGFDDSPVLDSKMVSEMAEHLNHPTPHTVEEKAFVSELILSPEEKNIVALLKVTEAIHDQRKKINLTGNYVMFRFIDELIKRKGFDRNLVKRAFWNEFSKFFSEPETFLKRLKDRHEASFVLLGDECFYLDYMALVPRKAMDTGVCKGTPASKGKVVGKAKIIFGPAEFDRFNAGEILLTEMTRPDFLPIMRKAKAIVTDEGGLMCHAAIVSRELKIPCIVGTKTVTRLFKDGDMLEVDANEGVVRIIK